MSEPWHLPTLEESVVPIRRGSGFFIGPGVLLTARHVVKDLAVGETISTKLAGRVVELKLTDVLQALDVAILHSEDLSIPWLPVDKSPSIGDRLVSFGFPQSHSGGDAFSAQVEGQTTDGEVRLLKFRGGQVTPGFSGAPLFNLDRHGVCGVVKSTRNARTDLGGRAIPLVSILADSPRLQHVLWQADSSFRGDSSANASDDERLDSLASEILSGRAVVVLGDVLGTMRAPGRHAVAEYIRSLPVALREQAAGTSQLLTFLRADRGGTSESYRRLAALPFRTAVTLHPDVELERSLSSYRPLVIDDSMMVSELGAGEQELYLMGGSVLFGRGLIIGQSNRDDLRNRYQHLGQGLRDRLAMAPVLFLSCDFSDWRTKQLLYDILGHRTSRDGQLFSSMLLPGTEIGLPGDVQVIQLDAESLLDAVTQKISDRRPLKVKTWTSEAPHCSGYRYLDYYTAADRSVFFGRDVEVLELERSILSSPNRLSVLCGRSGTGKTSLVRAGLLARMDRNGEMRGQYVRCTEDPLETLENQISMLLVGEPYRFEDDPNLTVLRSRLETLQSPLVFVIDQVEEGLIKGGPVLMTEFVKVLYRLLLSDWFPGRILLVIREDYLPVMANVDVSFARLLETVIRLKDLDRSAASAAVEGTARAMGWSCEPGFVSAVLDDLSPDRVLPAHLQIVCHRVQIECSAEKSLSLSAYVRLGRAAAILRDHVEMALAGTPIAQSEQVKRVLGALVTGSGTKDLLDCSQIARRAGLGHDEVTEIVHRLVHESRLVREVPGEGIRFELAHESLVSTISEWLDSADSARRAVQDILDQEVATAHRYPAHIVSDDRLLLIDEALDRLDVDDEALGLLASSFCVRGSVPLHIATMLAGRPKEFLIGCLLVRPVCADPGQFNAVLRSSVSKLLPEFSLGDLPENLAASAREALVDGDPGVVTGLVRCMTLDATTAGQVLEMFATHKRLEPSDLANIASCGTLKTLAMSAGPVLGITGAGARAGLMLLLSYCDTCLPSRVEASALLEHFFSTLPRTMRRQDVLSVAKRFFKEPERPRNLRVLAALLPTLARPKAGLTQPHSTTTAVLDFTGSLIESIDADQGLLLCASLMAVVRTQEGLDTTTGAALRRLIVVCISELPSDCASIEGQLSTDESIADDLLASIAWTTVLEPDAGNRSWQLERGWQRLRQVLLALGDIDFHPYDRDGATRSSEEWLLENERTDESLESVSEPSDDELQDLEDLLAEELTELDDWDPSDLVDTLEHDELEYSEEPHEVWIATRWGGYE